MTSQQKWVRSFFFSFCRLSCITFLIGDYIVYSRWRESGGDLLCCCCNTPAGPAKDNLYLALMRVAKVFVSLSTFLFFLLALAAGAVGDGGSTRILA
jgi:hypothetical protein